MSEITTTRTFEELLPSTDPTYRTTKRKEVQLLFSDFVKKWEKNQIYLTDASALRKALDEYEMLQGGNGPGTGDDFGVIGAESYYFWLQKQIHSDQEEFLSGANKADEFAVQMQNTLLFFELSLSSISPEKQSEFLSTPLLEPYRHFLEKKFAEAKHLLTPEGEKILNILSKTSYENRVSMVEKILAEHEVDNLSFEQLLHLCGDQDEGKRKRAEQQVHEILAELAPIAENELNSVLEYKKEVDQLRNFSSPEASRFLNDDIESEVVEAMVSQVKASYSISQQFYKLKAKLLGKDTLTYAEKILKYGSLDKEYSFDEAVATVRETINVLDPVF
ncbi:MAG: hypothetical protein LBD11_06265 [Candidatus Peribacteria bacterium]|jgi:oligoendopeptidase F|nr:hypothetical protein [Candidatus Peribacteria bacterium]